MLWRGRLDLPFTLLLLLLSRLTLTLQLLLPLRF